MLLDHNPLQGLKLPQEDNPRRLMLDDERYEAMRAVARQVSPLFELALILAHETGHRIGAIRLMRWSHVDLKGGTVLWPAINDKIGFEHTTPVSQEAMLALQRARADQPAIGDAWIFPASDNPAQPYHADTFAKWWRRAEKLAGLEHVERLGWQGLRRKFATELKGAPTTDVCGLGGWKDKGTMLRCYQQPDQATMREALDQRRRLRVAGRA
jgi:integrase